MPATEHRRSRRLTAAPAAALASTVAAAALALAGAPSAGAVDVPAGAGATASSLSSPTTLSSVDEAGQQAALDYWTPERMAAARPATADVSASSALAGSPSGDGTAPIAPQAGQTAPDALTDAGPDEAADPARSTLAVGEAPRVTRGQRAAAPVVTGGAVSASATWTGAGPVTAKVGRLYFTQAGTNYECSASSVDSANESVVVTAGHCLTENGAASTNVMFVPGLAGGSEPFGRWSATKLFTTSQWRTGNQVKAEALNYDVGFAVLARKGGKSLADTVGTLGIGFDAPLDRVTVFGYPGHGATSDGYTLKYCTGWRFTDTKTTDQGTACSMAGGSSGGPWISGFQPEAGTGTVTSVVSFSYNDAPQLLFGPLFGSVVRGVYQQASAVPVP